MRLGMIGYPITCLGPGKRVGLWVRGCARDCPGCVSKPFQSFDDVYEVPLEDILKDIDARNTGEKRITISGGEPFLQSELLALLEALRERGYFDVMVYTGFTYEELVADEEKRKCLALIDVLVDGPYRQELNDDLPLRGSSNQRVIVLNTALENEYLPCLKGSRRYQIEYLGEGKGNFYGIPPKGLDLTKLTEITD